MEERITKLAEANSNENRQRYALEWKKTGKPVVGILDYYVPEELLMAAGILPFHVSGTSKSDLLHAELYRWHHSDQFCTHVLEAVLSGECDFLDGIITTNWDDDMRKLWDAFEHVGKPSFRPMLHVPRLDTEFSIRYYAEDLRGLAEQLEGLSGGKITEESLRQAIEQKGRTRALLRRLYELRKREEPPVSGTEALKLVLAAQIMSKEEYNREMEEIARYLENRKAKVKALRPRILVASDHLDNPGYIQLIEDCGALVAMDDMDTGARYFWYEVEADGDPFYVLAKSYLSKPSCPRTFFWDRQVEQLIQWAREFSIDGVLNFVQLYSSDRTVSWSYLRKRAKEENIPFINLVREYHLANMGQLRTRIEAFVEML